MAWGRIALTKVGERNSNHRHHEAQSFHHNHASHNSSNVASGHLISCNSNNHNNNDIFHPMTYWSKASRRPCLFAKVAASQMAGMSFLSNASFRAKRNGEKLLLLGNFDESVMLRRSNVKKKEENTCVNNFV